jgi:2-polyprenyl-3-methyl-5-hydroxy-6-metoxy-1,4-benzoquinol methylase
MSWALGDLPYLAIAVQPDLDNVRRSLGGCCLLYVAGRIIDDLADRHFLYRGQRPTVLSSLVTSGITPDTEAATIVVALLLCFEALSQFAAAQPETSITPLRQLVDYNRRALTGLLLERSSRQNWNAAYYRRLIELKNVDYWRILYSALDPTFSSPLYPFLCSYYTFAQKLNDVQGYSRDEAQGLPNLISIERIPGADPFPTVRAQLASNLLQMGDVARELPEPGRSVAFVKLLETQLEAHRLLGLDKQDNGAASSSSRIDLFWHSRLEDFVDRLGADVLEETACPVCDEAYRQYYFRAQGFALNRCNRCGHVYVSPRLQPAVQQRLANELATGFEDPFLASQKLGAEYLCRHLRRFAPGPRLLDIGFGAGYLMRMARAYGFQVYGIDDSAASIKDLAPLFGRRLRKVHVSDSPLPWGSFDTVVMSHVLEHLPQPAPVLKRVREVMNRQAIIYVAVPDIESLQFRLFGRAWGAINPVAHYQFFSQSSLTRLLEDCGFEVIGRTRHPPFSGKGREPWMKLFRKLGGDESGELAMLARVPGDSYGLASHGEASAGD